MTEWPRRYFSDLYGRQLAAQFTKEKSEEQARVVARVLRLRKGMRVLDMPCGFGRLTLPLARLGFSMTGVDLTESYVRKARRLARAGRLDVRFLAQDMRRIEFHEEFDAAFNWFTSFGYYSDEDNLLCLKKLHDALRPGGQALIETMNISWLLPHFRPHSEQTFGGMRIVHSRRYDAQRGCISQTRTIFYHGRRTRCSDCIRFYAGVEMRQLLRKAGFADIRLHGHNRLEDPPKPRFTRHSRRLIAIARRP
jgi:2-polyprenyl-3-methyl-5-hydroxy-6-metoxy-1,4-benzoquinol methylase